MLSDDDHLRLRELLPWYANGTLAHGNSELLRTHLAGCASCLTELAQCAQIAAGLRAREVGAWRPSAAHRAGVLAAIDAAEGRDPSPPRRDGLGRLLSWLARSLRPLRPLRFALAAQAALIAVLGAALVLPMHDSKYETLSQGESSGIARGARLRVVFGEEVTEREWRELLLAIGGSIAQGPSALGVYTVALETPDGAHALALLRAHPKVRLAELVDTGGRR